MSDEHFDVVIIGAGVNGAGIARDCALRGLKTLLLEKGDIASATSSASTKLIHGGLRYLEYYDFKLVRESLLERQRLLNIAPHIIWPLEFRLPHAPDIRPFWMIRAGLYLYDLLSFSPRLKNTVGYSCVKKDPHSDLKDTSRKIISYRDCWVDDARLVILNAKDAQRNGAVIMPHCKCVGISHQNDMWHVNVNIRGFQNVFQARTVINAAGPWVYKLLEDQGLVSDKTPRVRLVQGSHIIVPRYLAGEHAWILQQPDKRIVFAIPYERDFTLIGTTERDIQGDPSNASITEEEIDYLINAVNRSFSQQISRSDIRHTYAGVRPLFDDNATESRQVTRDYRLHETHRAKNMMVSVFGGKLTTYRTLAKDVVDRICHHVSLEKPCVTDRIALPGGEIDGGDIESYIHKLQKDFPQVEEKHMRRLWQCYGTAARDILSQPRGRHFGADLYESEVLYLINHEWAQAAEDILYRRTKCGLHMTQSERDQLGVYLAERKNNV
jgi:glycerol-3-phosphate dehydrogenase